MRPGVFREGIGRVADFFFGKKEKEVHIHIAIDSVKRIETILMSRTGIVRGMSL